MLVLTRAPPILRSLIIAFLKRYSQKHTNIADNASRLFASLPARQLCTLADVDLQLDSDPVNLASPLQVDTAPNARPVQDLTSSPTHPKATKPTFVVASDADLQRFLDKNKNRNTTKTTATWVNRFETWRNVRKLPHALEDIPESELDGILQRFFAELRKQDGGEYEPDSLRTMLASLDRFLRDKGRLYSILKDKSFEGCRKLLNGKAIELREKGMGKGK